jgi:hypothetical protein
MKYSAAIGRAIPCSIIGLFGGGYLASLLLAVGIAFSNRSPQIHDWLSAPIAAFPLLAVALLVAAPVTLLVGCPLYAALLQRGLASFVSVLLVVLVVAGATVVLVDPAIGYLVALYGAAIGLVTHTAQRVRSNNSSKPTPLRGSA